MAVIHNAKGTITTALGTGIGSIPILAGELTRYSIKPTTVTTTYNYTVTDTDGFIVADGQNETGEVAEKLKIAVRDGLVLTISSSSVDEDFTFSFGFIEQY